MKVLLLEIPTVKKEFPENNSHLDLDFEIHRPVYTGAICPQGAKLYSSAFAIKFGEPGLIEARHLSSFAISYKINLFSRYIYLWPFSDKLQPGSLIRHDGRIDPEHMLLWNVLFESVLVQE